MVTLTRSRRRVRMAMLVDNSCRLRRGVMRRDCWVCCSGSAERESEESEEEVVTEEREVE